MPGKILGIDLGTNSIGWAIINRDGQNDCEVKLLDYGTHIFQEGVAHDKTGEKPATKDRTEARLSRRHYDRRRLRKIDLLKILIKHNLCPYISNAELSEWHYKKIYPKSIEFRKWQQTDDKINKNPYKCRHDALTQKLNLSNQSERYLLGRALYHLAQRRGFLSNRKDLSRESEGDVKKGIDYLSSEIDKAGMKYPGEYFYQLYQNGTKIRGRYQHRILHIETEFYAICCMQGLEEHIVKELHKVIFFQRPLKSQKRMIGHCTLERSKQRCAISHPEFEEFRMLSFINNIKIQHPNESTYRPLNDKEKALIYPLFFRKSIINKASFDFEDIAKKLSGRNKYADSDGDESSIRFNFHMSQSVPACPVTTSLKSVFGENISEFLRKNYVRATGKTDREILNDIWHVLLTFDSYEKLIEWSKQNLGLEDTNFADIRIPQGYASLSLKAIRKIVPYLRKGLRYDEAVFVANLPTVLDAWEYRTEEDKQKVIDDICNTLNQFVQSEYTPNKTTAVKRYLEDVYDFNFDKIDRLYHPSKIEMYPEAEINRNGELLLGSPRISALRNPMAMRALFRLRNLINTLLKEKKIDHTTRINIEFSRMLNNANMRKAIEREQREKESINSKYANEIRHLYKESVGRAIEPTDVDILKYALWEEQKHLCLYTGRQIGIADFLGDNPKFDIEHTIPRSLGGDDSSANKTLCEINYNRKTKRNILPSNLSDCEIIKERIKQIGWNKKIEDLTSQIGHLRVSGYMTKESKDLIIQKRNYLNIKLSYWRDKVKRFTMTDLPEGFTNRQGVDISIINKYAYHYLQTLFRSENRQIFTIKGATTAEFRVMWGLQREYTSKERINHCHHTIDAIVIACIGRNEYHRWAEYKRAMEEHRLDGKNKPTFEKPWPTFTEDVKCVINSLIVAHHTDDRRLRNTKKCLRKRGKILRNSNNDVKYQQGDSARVKLHQDTFYGAVMRDGEIKCVVRKPIDELSEKDIQNIVDTEIRKIVEREVESRGIKNLSSEPIYQNKAKNIEIKRVRIFTPTITNPIALKKHRDASSKAYKRDYLVANDTNYCLGIYEGEDKKGKIVKTFELISNLEAVKRKKAKMEILALSDKNDYPLRHTLKPGLMVLFYEKSPQELLDADKKELVKRLYRIHGISSMRLGKYSYGKATFKHHQNAQPASVLKYQSGAWKCGEELRGGIKMYHTQFNGYVEGEDFILTPTGEIRFLH